MSLAASASLDPLSATFAALADPTRRAILQRLMKGESTVSELASPFQMSLPAVTKHLRVLERAGLITKGRLAQSRPCRIAAQPLKEATDWMVQYREFWEQRLDRLDAYLQEIQSGSIPKRATARTTRRVVKQSTVKSQPKKRQKS